MSLITVNRCKYNLFDNNIIIARDHENYHFLKLRIVISLNKYAIKDEGVTRVIRYKSDKTNILQITLNWMCIFFLSRYIEWNYIFYLLIASEDLFRSYAWT